MESARESEKVTERMGESERESPAPNGSLDSKVPTVKSEYRRPKADWIGLGMSFDLSPPKCRQRLEHLSPPNKKLSSQFFALMTCSGMSTPISSIMK